PLPPSQVSLAAEAPASTLLMLMIPTAPSLEVIASKAFSMLFESVRMPGPIRVTLHEFGARLPLKKPATVWLPFTVTVKGGWPLPVPTPKRAAVASSQFTGVAVPPEAVLQTVLSHVPVKSPVYGTGTTPAGSQYVTAAAAL